MIIRRAGDLRWSDVTPKNEYLNRRRFLGAALGAAAFGLGTARAASKLAGYGKSKFSTSEKQTPYQAITTYNNYYEFGTGKDEPAKYAGTLKPEPWTVRIEGEAVKKGPLDFEKIMKLAPLEEYIYRLRCVEAWSMVVPWIGLPLAAVVKYAEPTPKAKYVAFETLYDTKQMPRSGWAGIPLPYVEGLRMDEAMHPLAILAVGLYGEVLPNQNGAPLRLVVPWKYGFKSIKSIVKIRFTEKEPPTTWSIANRGEYGFYSNVNPNVDHPRWSQAKERRIGEFFKRDTVLFNGYGEQVANLYSGMDLKKYY